MMAHLVLLCLICGAACLVCCDASESSERLQNSSPEVTVVPGDCNDAQLGAIAETPGLHTLELSATNVTIPGLHVLKRAKSLRVLNLRELGLDDESLLALPELPQVEEVDLANNQLEGHSSAAIARAFPGLVTLRIGANRLTPAGIQLLCQSLPKLRFLDVCAHALTRDALRSIGELKDLRVLDLHCCDVADQWLSELRPLSKLQHCILYGNEITDAGLDAFGMHDSLRRLDLDDTHVSGSAVSRVSPRLECLEIGGPHVSDRTLFFVGNCTQLRKLSVNSGLVTDEGVAHLAKLPLDELRLWNCGITDKGLSCLLMTSATLRSLRLWGTLVRDDGFDVIAQSEQLTELEVGPTGIGNEAVRLISHNTHLRALELVSPQIDDSALVHLERMKQLRLLRIASPALTVEGFRRLQEKSPYLRIRRD